MLRIDLGATSYMQKLFPPVTKSPARSSTQNQAASLTILPYIYLLGIRVTTRVSLMLKLIKRSFRIISRGIPTPNGVSAQTVLHGLYEFA